MIAPANPKKPLPPILASYLRDNATSPGYATQLAISWRHLGRYLRREPEPAELTAAILSGFVESFSDRSPRTAKNHRNNCLRLLRWAETAGELPSCPNPRLVRSPKVPPPMPSAWWEWEIKALIAAARMLPGVMRSGAPRAKYFPALMAFALESGLRKGDLMRVSTDDVDGTRGAVRMSKTREVQVFKLSRQTAAEFRELAKLTGSKRPFATVRCHRTIRRWFDRAKKIAGVSIRPKQILQQIRRTGATAWEIEDENYTSRYLGHRTAGMKVNYVDRSKAAKDARDFPFSVN